MRRAVSGPSGRSSTSRFACRAARGPAVRSSPRIFSRAAPRSSDTPCTSPIASAVAASKRSPVTKYRRAALSPIFRSANGEITAGTIPSFTSENANTARGSRDHDVAARHEPDAAAQGVALDEGDDRGGAAVDGLEHAPHGIRIGDVRLDVEIG